MEAVIKIPPGIKRGQEFDFYLIDPDTGEQKQFSARAEKNGRAKKPRPRQSVIITLAEWDTAKKAISQEDLEQQRIWAKQIAEQGAAKVLKGEEEEEAEKSRAANKRAKKKEKKKRRKKKQKDKRAAAKAAEAAAAAKALELQDYLNEMVEEAHSREAAAAEAAEEKVKTAARRRETALGRHRQRKPRRRYLVEWRPEGRPRTTSAPPSITYARPPPPRLPPRQTRRAEGARSFGDADNLDWVSTTTSAPTEKARRKAAARANAAITAAAPTRKVKGGRRKTHRRRRASKKRRHRRQLLKSGGCRPLRRRTRRKRRKN